RQKRRWSRPQTHRPRGSERARLGEVKRGAALRTLSGARRGASAGRGVGGPLAPAAGASGLGAGLGAGPGRAAGRLRPFAGPRLSAREERRGGAPLGRALGFQPPLPRAPPAPGPLAGAGRDLVTELGRQRCIVGAFKATGSAARPSGPPGHARQARDASQPPPARDAPRPEDPRGDDQCL
ncbi:hypothetical protein P7K49_019474, partial [Saguinus oedipus]